MVLHLRAAEEYGVFARYILKAAELAPEDEVRLILSGYTDRADFERYASADERYQLRLADRLVEVTEALRQFVARARG